MVLIYNQDTQELSWEVRSNVLPHSLYSAGVTTDGILIYITGGSTDSTGLTDNLFTYNPLSNTIKHRKSMPWGRVYMISIYFDGYIFVPGGWGRSRNNPDTNSPTDTILKYTILNNSWEELPLQLPHPVYYHASAIINID